MKPRADALTPNDWASVRDVLRDMADAIDKINSLLAAGGLTASPPAGASSPADGDQ